MSLVLATLGQIADMKRRKNPKLSRRPQNGPMHPVIKGLKKCSRCGEEKDAYLCFSWRKRPGGYKAPRAECSACQYLDLKDYRRRAKCGN